MSKTYRIKSLSTGSSDARVSGLMQQDIDPAVYRPARPLTGQQHGQ
ncbi:MAG: hypothetical protein IID15_07730 [Candidatus Marinimicrobia bacterium]|nr:hypothetical protein [Candidatus Neomarinimicrobiota bacterium]